MKGAGQQDNYYQLTDDVETSVAELLANAVRNVALEAGYVLALLGRFHRQHLAVVREHILVRI